jgi:hypothetical protein
VVTGAVADDEEDPVVTGPSAADDEDEGGPVVGILNTGLGAVRGGTGNKAGEGAELEEAEAELEAELEAEAEAELEELPGKEAELEERTGSALKNSFISTRDFDSASAGKGPASGYIILFIRIES